MFRSLTIALVFGSISIFNGCVVEPEDLLPLRPGDRAPEYSAVSLDGERVSTQSLRGQVIVVYRWATWCKPCEPTIVALEDLHRQHAAEGLQIVGIHVPREPAERVRLFLHERQISFPVVIDDSFRAQFAFRWRPGIPQTVVIDRSGSVVGHWYGAFDPTDVQYVNMLRRLLRSV